MKLTLDRRSKIPFFIQIAEQLRYMIISEQLDADTSLPSSRHLAEFFSVNRQTIYNAIKVLEEEGLVEVKRGTGIFVKQAAIPPAKNDEMLLSIVQTAIAQAQKAGYTCQDVVQAISCICTPALPDLPQRDDSYLVFIECNEMTLISYKKDIERELDIRVVPYLLEDLVAADTQTWQTIAQATLVVTPFAHLHAVKKLLECTNANILGIFAGPANNLMLTIKNWPSKSNVLVIMKTRIGAVEVMQSIIDAGIEFEQITCISLDVPDIKQQVACAERLIISNTAYQAVKDLLSPDQVVAVYENKLDHASFRMLSMLMEAL